jgi:TolB protein
VYVMDKDGGALTDVTNSPAGDIFPSWAPDGSRLVYASRGDEGYRLRIVARDGTHLTPLTDGSGAYDDSFPTWSAAGPK